MGKEHHTTVRLITGYGLSILLIPAYVNMFGVWKLLNLMLGEFVMLVLPVIITLALLTVILFLYRKRIQTSRSAPALLPGIIGAAFCLFALTVPDPQFPVKRIHVAEYLLLSLVVRYTMSCRLQGYPLLFFSALFAALLGVHDEFLQGLHPARTYGLRDMTVNSLGAWGGALIWHGMGVFSNTAKPLVKTVQFRLQSSSLYIFWLLAGVAALITPLVWYRGLDLPLWPAMPLFAAVVLYSLYENRFPGTWKHGITSVSVLSFSLILYPALTHVATLSFY